MRDYGPLLDALRGVTWPSRGAVLAGTAGTHRSRLRGLSAEFTEYRPYRQGDDPRRLDWKLLARTDRAYLRITNDRATLATVMLVDASASLAFPAGSFDKWRQACGIAVGLAAVAHASGDPVGLVAVDGTTAVRVAPRTRRGVVAEIARVLSSDTLPARPGAAAAGTAGLPSALAALRGVPRVAIVSDFLADEDELLREARTLAAGGSEVFAVQIVAREELDPPARAVLATDPEAPDVRRPLTPDSVAAYQNAFAAWRQQLARAWRTAGATFAEVATNEAPARAVRRIAAASQGARAS